MTPPSAVLAFCLALGPPNGPWAVQVHGYTTRDVEGDSIRWTVTGAVCGHPRVLAIDPVDATRYPWRKVADRIADRAESALRAVGIPGHAWPAHPGNLFRGEHTITHERSPGLL